MTKPLKNPKPKKKRKHYQVVDDFTKQAHKEGFVARSIFKLQEIDQKIKLFQKGQKILDLGASPGSWMQFASNKIGPTGVVVGLDIVELRVSAANMHFFMQDMTDIEGVISHVGEWAPFDIIQSDAMVKTNGIVDSDCAKSIQLVESGILLAQSELLKSGGIFLAKIFEGPGFNPFWNEFRMTFKGSKVFRPEAIRKGSREIYIMGYKK
ncbi:MAG: RlmE family RNA methyltransferase [Bdellovibrionota bacterium]